MRYFIFFLIFMFCFASVNANDFNIQYPVGTDIFKVSNTGDVYALRNIEAINISASDYISAPNITAVKINATQGIFSYIDKLEMTAPGIPPTDFLRLYVEDFKGFSIYKYIDDTGMVRELVRDNVFVGKNEGGSTIPAGSAVYDCGSSGNVPLFCLAKADGLTTLPNIGVTIEDIDDGDFGRAMIVGLLEHIDTSEYLEGDILYVSDTEAGKFTTTIPITPHLIQEVGEVLVSGIEKFGAIQIAIKSLKGNEFGTINNYIVHGNLSSLGSYNSLAGELVVDDNITTTGWFLGKVNWSNIQNKFITTVDNVYLYMSGTTATLNETKLNSTINTITVAANSSMKEYSDAQDVILNTKIDSVGNWSDDQADYMPSSIIQSNYFNLSQDETVTGITTFNSPTYFRNNVTLTTPYAMSVNESLYLEDISGTTKIVLNASGNSYFNAGNVGIGTNDAKSKLQVSNFDTNFIWTPNGRTAAIFEGSSSGTVINVVAPAGDTQTSVWFSNSTDQGLGRIRYEPQTSQLSFWTANGKHLTIDKLGNVGIGTTTPGKILDLKSSDALAIRFYNGTSDFKAGLEIATSAGQMIATSAVGDFAIRSQNNMLFSTGGNTERMRIDDTGNVGIGTTSPKGGLHISDDGAFPLILEQADSSNGYGATILFNNSGTGGDYFNLGVSSTKNAGVGGGKFYISNRDNDYHFVILNDTGNIGIGTTSPSSKLDVAGNFEVDGSDFFVNATSDKVGIGISTPSDKLHVYFPNGAGPISGRYGALIQSVDTTVTFAGTLLGLLSSRGNTDAYNLFSAANSAGTKFIIQGNGNVGIGTTTPNSRLHVAGETNITGISADGTGKAVCIKADGNLGTCTNAVGAGGTCTCA